MKLTPKRYWISGHKRYLTLPWIDKPSIFATQVIKYLPKNGKLLDLGAGQGQDSRFFTKKGYDVLCTDFSDFALKIAKEKASGEKLNIKFFEVDVSRKLPFPNNEFDIVYSHLALHYWDKEKTKRIFNEVLRVLKTGGVFAAIFNSIYDPEIAELRKIGQNYYFDEKIGMARSYYSVSYMNDLIDGSFDIKMIDEKGRTYKDINEKLFRFIGLKK